MNTRPSATSEISLKRQKIRSKIVQNACQKHVKKTVIFILFSYYFGSFTSVTVDDRHRDPVVGERESRARIPGEGGNPHLLSPNF